jgi:hypothetical protein
MPSRRLRRRTLLVGGLAAGVVALLTGDRAPPGPPRPPATIDPLDYFLNQQSGGLTGSHLLVQTIDRAARRSVICKGDAARFEVHAWDDAFIYLTLDHDPERAYQLMPGVWLPRRMTVGDELVAPPTTTITWYGGGCRPLRTEPYSYTIKLEHLLPNFNVGGDLGWQEVIVVRYLPAGGRAERFYYSKAWGWIAWEEYDLDGRLRHRTQFDRPVATRLTPRISPACAALLLAG